MQIETKMAYMQTVISKTLYTVLLLCTSVGLQMEIKQHTQNIVFCGGNFKMFRRKRKLHNIEVLCFGTVIGCSDHSKGKS